MRIFAQKCAILQAARQNDQSHQPSEKTASIAVYEGRRVIEYARRLALHTRKVRPIDYSRCKKYSRANGKTRKEALEKNQNNPVNGLDVSQQIVTAVIPDAAVENALPPLTPEDREKLYERLRNNVPEPLQKEHRWGLLYDTGKKRKMPIGGHPSATMNLEQAIDAHRNYKGRGEQRPCNRILHRRENELWAEAGDTTGSTLYLVGLR